MAYYQVMVEMVHLTMGHQVIRTHHELKSSDWAKSIANLCKVESNTQDRVQAGPEQASKLHEQVARPTVIQCSFPAHFIWQYVGLIILNRWWGDLNMNHYGWLSMLVEVEKALLLLPRSKIRMNDSKGGQSSQWAVHLVIWFRWREKSSNVRICIHLWQQWMT
jgi:hypothetical protein